MKNSKPKCEKLTEFSEWDMYKKLKKQKTVTPRKIIINLMESKGKILKLAIEKTTKIIMTSDFSVKTIRKIDNKAMFFKIMEW